MTLSSAVHKLMHTPIASAASLQTIHISLPGTQLENTATGSRVSVTSKTDRKEAQSSSADKRKESGGLGGESSHHRQYSAKKSRQDDNDIYTRLHPLQDYLHPGLDGTSFFLPYLYSQIEFDTSCTWKWCSVESSGYITPAILAK